MRQETIGILWLLNGANLLLTSPDCHTGENDGYGGSIKYSQLSIDSTECGYWAEISGCLNDIHGIGTYIENVYLVKDDEEILVRTRTSNSANATGAYLSSGYIFENYGLHKFTLTQTCQSGYIHYYEFYLNYEDPNTELEDVCHASGTLTSSGSNDITNKKTITLSGNVHDDSGLTAYDIYYRLIDDTEEKLYYEKSSFYGEVTDTEFEKNFTFPDYGTYYISLKVRCANKSVHEVDGLVLTYFDHSGKIGDILWDIDENGHLTITGEGDYINYITSSTGNPPWSKKDVKTATVSVTGITSIANMFHDCSNLTNVNLSELDTSNVTDMSEMFSGCGKLEKLTMGNFNTENAITMERMFLDCSSLTDLDLSGFDTARVTNMDLMFNSCESLTSLDLSGFNTEKVTGVYEMFSGCRKLEELDLSSFDLSSLEDDTFLFTSCDSLKKIYTPRNLSVSVSLDEAENKWHLDGQEIEELPKNLDHSVLITKGSAPTAVEAHIMASKKKKVYECGEELTIDDLTVQYYGTDGKVTIVENSNYTTNKGSIDMNTLGSKELCVTYNDNGKELKATVKLTVRKAAEDIAEGKSNNINWKIDGRGKLTVTGTGDYERQPGYGYAPWYSYRAKIKEAEIEVADITDASYMFDECVNLTTVDVNGLHTENITDMRYMFSFCDSLTELNLNGFNTGNVKDMSGMFSGCYNLEKLDLSGFNTINVEDMSDMFNDCESLSDLNLSSFDLSGIESELAGACMFNACWNLSTLRTPKNCKVNIALPSGESDKWYREDGTECTALPTGLAASILLYKNNRPEDIRDITVEFDLQGLGTKIGPVTVKSGEKIIKPANPTAEGYSFEGWYREPECKTAWDFTKDTVTADITLYAKWTQNQSDGYDLSSFNFQMTDIRNPEKKAEFNGADGKQAVIIFGGIGTCSRTESALESLSNLTSMADMSRLNIYAFEINKASDDTIRERTANISSQIIINSIENDTAYNNLFINCFRETLGSGSLSMPLIIYKGTNGKIYKYTTNATDLPSIVKNIEEGGLKINYHASCQMLNITGEARYEQAWEVLVRLNEERAKEGLNALEMDSDLLEAAMLRAAECSLYYSHTRPDGTECLTASNKISGENIAVGHKNANEVMDSWMNSEGHRKNILNSGYRSVGIGCFYINGTYRWVQCFGINNVTDAAKKSNIQKTYTIKAVLEHVSPYLVEESGNLKTGEIIQLKIESSHEVYRTSIDADSYQWSSSDTAVADVSSIGLVTAKKEGSAVITGHNISDETLTLTYSLTVGEGAEGEFIVTFDSQGGTEVLAAKAAKDSVILEPKAPTRKGYTFEAWYKESICVNKWDFANDRVTDNITLYAHWIEGEQPDDPPTDPDDTENQGDGLWVSGISKSGYSYTGEAIKPAVKVYDKTTLLTEKTDYTVSYKNNTKAGKATITVTGKGNYAGKETVTFDILPVDMGSEEIHAMDYYVKIGSKAQKPVPELYYMGTKLKNNKDFTILYSNTSNVYTQTGEYSVTVTGEGNYTGTRTLTLIAVEKIVKPKPVSIAKATLNGFDKSFTYTGKACKQECTLVVKTSEGEKILTEGMDYTIQYANNIKAGTATVTYYGRNGYTGKLKKTYKILPYDILNDVKSKIKYENYFECIYAKGGSKPKPVVTFDGKAMKEGVDYTLSYKNNKAVFGKQAPCVTVNGKGCFKGKIPIYFTIKAQDLSQMILVSGDKVYKNKANIYKITPKLMDLDGKQLSAGKDFDQKSITYVYENDVVLENGISKTAGSEIEKTDIIPADTQIRITLNCGSGSNYTGTFTGVYRIVKADIKSAKVTIPKQIYTGNEITLDKSQITVKFSGVKLNSEDYEIIRYDNNVKKGKASVTIKGNGNYGGIKTVKFTIGTKGFLWWWRK